jgi:hypothetical protein
MCSTPPPGLRLRRRCGRAPPLPAGGEDVRVLSSIAVWRCREPGCAGEQGHHGQHGPSLPGVRASDVQHGQRVRARAGGTNAPHRRLNTCAVVQLGAAQVRGSARQRERGLVASGLAHARMRHARSVGHRRRPPASHAHVFTVLQTRSQQ